MENIESLHNLCHVLMEELEEYSRKIEKADGMNAGDLEAVDKLAHALKSIKTTIAMIEANSDGYSGRYMPRYAYGDGYHMDGMSYAGRRNARRDSMGRYSGNYSYADEIESIKADMRELSAKLPEEHRRKVERALDDLR